MCPQTHGHIKKTIQKTREKPAILKDEMRFETETRLAGTGLKSTSHIRVRDRLHQIADLGLQVIVRDDQAANGRSEVTTACCYGVIHSGLEFVGIHRFGLWLLRHNDAPAALSRNIVLHAATDAVGLV
jgi:hypothetical protein